MKIKNFYYYGYPDGEQFSQPIGNVAAQSAHAIANIGTSLPGTDPRGSTSNVFNEKTPGPITQIKHPDWQRETLNWQKWRANFEGGENFIRYYLRKFSARENNEDWQMRLQTSPTPTFAKAGIIEIKNSIFQRIADVTRDGGPETYDKAEKGELGGVDRLGGTMNWFIGDMVIPEMLVMKKVGVFVDMPPLGQSPSLADKGTKHPYLYTYKAENILSWAFDYDQHGLYYTSLLLLDHKYEVDLTTGLPKGNEVERYRLLRLIAGNVHVAYFDRHGNFEGSIVLNIPRIPFVMFEISDSLMRDVANHQIALLNMTSSDVAYSTKGNFPFYVEQTDNKTNNQYLKSVVQTQPIDPLSVQPPLTPMQHESAEITVGSVQGRKYGKDLEKPGFIAPPTEPLMASMSKQKDLKHEIRELLSLALSAVTGPKMASAESKDRDNQGLESGLSYIGLELQHGERRIAEFWSMWEGTQDFAQVKYPKRFKLHSPKDAREEAKELVEFKDEIPSQTFRREMSKLIAAKLLDTNVDDEVIETIEDEIDAAPGTVGNSKDISQDVEDAILSLETAAILRGYKKDEPVKAAADHAERLARITLAQAEQADAKQAASDAQQKSSESDPSARGNKDGSADPKAASKEKKNSIDTTTKDTTAKAVRGEGK